MTPEESRRPWVPGCLPWTNTEATLECEEVSGSSPLPLVPLDEAGTDSFLGQEQVPKDVKAEEEISALRSRLRKTFQEKVLMEQSCSRLEKEVALLTQQVTEDRQQAQAHADVEARRTAGSALKHCHQGIQTDDTLARQPSGSADMALLCQENDRLKQERAQLRAELARMSRAVQDLESQVAVSQDENANLSTGMEELDIQHQEAIEQIMVLKDATQKRYENLLAEFEEMKLKYEETVRLAEEKEENKNVAHCESQTSTEVSAEVKSKILIDLSEEIKNMITTDIPDKYYENGKSNASGLETVAAIEKMLSHTMTRVESSESKIRDLLKELRCKDDEVQEIEEENKTLRIKIEELKEQCDNLPTIAENNEDVEVFEGKIIALENEVSVLREVRSNLEVEHGNSRTEIESLIRQLQSAEAMSRNHDNLQTEILKFKENEQELLKKLNDAERSREELLSEVSHLQQTNDEQEKVIVDLKQSKLKLEEITHINRQMQEELAKIKDSELLYLKTQEELEQEKSLRLKLEEEKEKLFAELTKLESSEEYSHKQSIELQKEQNIRSQLQEENVRLQETIASLQDVDKEHVKLLDTLQTECMMKKQLEESLNVMHAEIKRLEKEEESLKKLSEQQNQESDLKIRELKALNTCLTQKCVKFEKEIFDLSERSDGLKIEKDSKDRKLCEMILEKSVSDKELETVKLAKDSLENELTELKSKICADKETLLSVFVDTFSEFLETSHVGRNVTFTDLHEYLSELAGVLSSLKKENEKLKAENLFLSESSQRLVSEVNDKTDCLLKMTSHMETLQVENHSMEDRLRNLTDTVSTGNQTDQPDGPEITQESYTEVRKTLEEREDKCRELEESYQKLLSSSEKSLNHVNDQLRNLHNERQQLIETVQTKHAECVKYHTEIQRLCTELAKAEQQRLAVTGQLQKQLEEKEEQLAALQASSDRQVAALTEQTHTLQNQLDYVSQLLRVTDRQEAEGQPASESPSAKTQSNKGEADENDTKKLEELYETIQQEQLRNKYLQDEVSEQHEKEAGLLRELQRLRGHLVSVEENYTQEMVRAEQQVQELNQRLSVAEERAKSSSTAYTSASIRANQQVESLGSQVRLLSEQKEKLSTQLAVAEDKLHKQGAALTNLQIVLEQFQRDKERDVAMENERIRQTLQQANNRNTELSNEIKALQLQLKEAKEGLSAASRLTEQLDHKSRAITELKQQGNLILFKNNFLKSVMLIIFLKHLLICTKNNCLTIKNF
ncbi:Golgi organization [Homalodisca vitripennis]|nr:Golgi organization [Homalodisca vitripennis]